MTSERIDKPTPAGGAYFVTYFKDADGNPADKSIAKHFEIIEYSASNEEIRRTYT